MTPYRARDPFDWPALLALIRAGFAAMEGRIDPPSSMHRLTAAAIARQAREGEVWVIGAPEPLGCVFLTARADALYLGKLAVAPSHRGRGLGRALVAAAEARAAELGLPAVELETRIELCENHALFGALGYARTAETAHPGFARPTSVTMRKEIAAR